ncbi:hypothetical protein B0H11DRAFT_1926495 [Mycena galericulata]|nr:hypothetical protein B0H11DRAFT_1926495 [Mycena galericulata]
MYRLRLTHHDHTPRATRWGDYGQVRMLFSSYHSKLLTGWGYSRVYPRSNELEYSGLSYCHEGMDVRAEIDYVVTILRREPSGGATMVKAYDQRDHAAGTLGGGDYHWVHIQFNSQHVKLLTGLAYRRVCLNNWRSNGKHC